MHADSSITRHHETFSLVQHAIPSPEKRLCRSQVLSLSRAKNVCRRWTPIQMKIASQALFTSVSRHSQTSKKPRGESIDSPLIPVRIKSLPADIAQEELKNLIKFDYYLLRYYATGRKAAGSIPHGVFKIIH